MNLAMAEPVKSKDPAAQRLTVAISAADYARLETLKAKLLAATGEKQSTQELASRWISEGITAAERTLEQ